MKCYISFILQYIVFQVLPSILFLKNNTEYLNIVGVRSKGHIRTYGRACGVAGTFCHRRQTR
jgi:hypothetical protein